MNKSLIWEKNIVKANKSPMCFILIRPNLYITLIKPILDKSLSLMGLIILSPLLILISFAIYLDNPGPIIFIQKRVGKGKRIFNLHKFRTMKVSAPHDIPTHEFSDPEQYITRVGKFLRKSSLDELPQLWDIFRGKMSIIGPRPALWNQKDLILKRDFYGANNIMPGLTGLAQIKGRDELDISNKAKYDGRYTKALNGRLKTALFMDIYCFCKTIINVLKSEGVVEGKNRKF